MKDDLTVKPIRSTVNLEAAQRMSAQYHREKSHELELKNLLADKNEIYREIFMRGYTIGFSHGLE
jgi:hypothetical protein